MSEQNIILKQWYKFETNDDRKVCLTLDERLKVYKKFGIKVGV